MAEDLCPLPRYKQIIIPFEDLNMKECTEIAKAFKSEEDVAISTGRFEIWEKDMKTGRLEKLQ